MRNSACFYSEFSLSSIAEGPTLEGDEAKSGQLKWTDEEIAAIRAVLKKLTSFRILNSNDAEDLVQDTLLTMIDKHRGMVLEKGPLAWGLGILRKKVGNYYRKAQRYASLDEHEAGIQPWMLAASPERKLFHEELCLIVDDVLAQIPASQRRAMELLISGLNAREIMEELHPVSYQNVINRLYRGRKKLTSALIRYGYGPDAAPGMRKMKRSNGRKARATAKTGLPA